MDQTVIGVFDTYDHAERAKQQLIARGFSANDVQVRVTTDSRGWHVDVEDEGDETDGWDDHFTGEDLDVLSAQLNSSIHRVTDDDPENENWRVLNAGVMPRDTQNWT